MNSKTNAPYTYTYLPNEGRTAAGQRAYRHAHEHTLPPTAQEKQVPQTHALSPLISTIDAFLAEQHAAALDAAAARPRSDSRGTMFVDVDDEGAMNVSFRNARPAPRAAEPQPQPRPQTKHKPQHEKRRDNAEPLPSGALWVLDADSPGLVGVYAPRYVTSSRTPHGVPATFERVGHNARGCGLYVEYGGSAREERSLRRLRSDSRHDYASSSPWSGSRSMEEEGVRMYPRPMRRVDVGRKKRLPDVPQQQQQQRRKSLLGTLKKMVRRLSCGEENGMHGVNGKRGSWERNGYWT